jgi:hypothetical protein
MKSAMESSRKFQEIRMGASLQKSRSSSVSPAKVFGLDSPSWVSALYRDDIINLLRRPRIPHLGQCPRYDNEWSEVL